MRFEDERYVRLFTRDTMTWLMLPWQSRCVLPLIARKVDRAGLLDLDDAGFDGLAVLLTVPKDVVEAGVQGAIAKDVLRLQGSTLIWPKFTAAQEAKQSDKARQKASRERARDLAMAASKGLAAVTPCDGADTPRDAKSHGVTERHADSKPVTPDQTRPSQRETLTAAPPPVAPKADFVSSAVPAASPSGPAEVSGSTPHVSIPPALVLESPPVVPEDPKSGVRKAAKPAKPEKTVPHTCPEDWAPSESVLAWCVGTAGITVSTALSEVPSFVDHWHSGKGHKEKRPGWDGSFRTWIRNALTRGDITIADPDDLPEEPSKSATHDPVTGKAYADQKPGVLTASLLEQLALAEDRMAPSWAKTEPQHTTARWAPAVKVTQ